MDTSCGVSRVLGHRSTNKSFNILPPPFPGIYTPSIRKFFLPGGDEIELCLGGEEKFEPVVSSSMVFFSCPNGIHVIVVKGGGGAG